MTSNSNAPFPPDLNPRPKKKRRPALSCVTCRDRKLKCDKERPRCGRCVHTGPDQPCVYIENQGRAGYQAEARPHDYMHSAAARSVRQIHHNPQTARSPFDATTTASHGSSNPQAENPNLESRLARLEKILVQAVNQSALDKEAVEYAIGSPADASAQNGSPEDTPLVVPKLPPMQRSDEDFMNYPGSYRGYGLTHPAMLLAEMPAFMARIRAEHNAKTLQLKHRIETWRAANMDSRDLWNDGSGFTSVIASLPSKEILDRLIYTYFDSFELEYPILDERRFIHAYETAWEGPRFSPSPQLLMTLLLVVATTINIYASQTSEPSPALDSGKSHLRQYIHLSERWLISRGTQAPDLDTVRLHCLLVLAKRYNGFARDQIWTTAGSMVRISMLIGLHAQAWRPGPDHEAYRNLWITVLELDLLTSVDSGMVPSVPISEFSRVAHAAQRRVLGANGSESEVPGFVRMAGSLGLRVEICCMLNSNVPEPTAQRTAEQEKKLKLYISAIIAQSPTDPANTPGSSTRQAFWVELSRVKLQKYLMMIYLPYTLEGNLQQRYPHYKKACSEAAITILSDHQAMLEKGDFSICLRIDDVFQAGLVVCNEIYQPNRTGASPMSQLTGYVSLIKPLLRSALSVLTQRLLHVGHWHGEYFLLCLAMGLVKTKTWPHKLSEYARQVLDLLEESCTFITTPKTPSTNSPAVNQTHMRQSSLAMPSHSTPHGNDSESLAYDPASEKDLFAGLDTVADSFQDIIEFLGLSYPLDSLDGYPNHGTY
ncbi:hypothetical protein MPH_06231 [Macrophomina phaseolina MS6]|uniref:Zn(2)-C6 fungal-type domain-containing protein n=1 Tax=Macrophomina phaseolina (strain MS6) TaxID=1126212 RepID=K2SHY5_MACPH|nr:hypothetical protein MPH_06231 [Macrophomina phaseolina MS6]